MPTQLEQAHLLAPYRKGNIGLPLGPASAVRVIDIDTEGPAPGFAPAFLNRVND